MAKKSGGKEAPRTYASKAQQAFVNAAGLEFAEKWNKQTKAAGKFKGLPAKVTPKGGR